MQTTQIEFNNHVVNRNPLLTDLKRIKKVAYLENDKIHGAYLTNWLQCRDIKCEVFATTTEFEQALHVKNYDLVLLDREIGEGAASLEMLSLIKASLGSAVPVTFVSSRNSREAILTAIKKSARDCSPKQPDHTVLSDRIRGLTGRRKTLGTAFMYEPYLIDHMLCRIWYKGKNIPLTPREYKLAITIFENPGKILSHEHLLNAVGGEVTRMPYNDIEHLVSRVKRKLKLDDYPQWQVDRVEDLGFRLTPV